MEFYIWWQKAVISAGDPGIVFALDATTGEILFRGAWLAAIHAASIVADGHLLLAADHGHVYLMVPGAE